MDSTAVMCCPPVFRVPLEEDEAVELAEVLKAMADPARLRLLSIIAAAPGGEVCACDLVEPLGRSQPTVSHHLSQLVRAGLISREQRGKWAWFRLNDERVAALRDCLAPTVDAATPC
jgi:ArsR family transcriptional regulator